MISAIGTLTKKIHCQPAYWVMIPPRSTPIAPPAPAMPPSAPSALLRSAPSAKVTVVIENTDGERIAAAAPCAVRAKISISDDWDSPAISEVSAKSPRPTMKKIRRPSRSPMRPPRSRNPPNVSA